MNEIRKTGLVMLIPLLALSGCASLFECDGYYETVYVQTQRCSAGYSDTDHCRGWTFGQKPVKQCRKYSSYTSNVLPLRSEGEQA